MLAGFVIFFLLMYMRRKAKSVLEKEQLRSGFQQTLLQSQLEIQEQTLKNISQEIHDNIGQALTLAKLNLNTMPGVSETQQESIITTKGIISKAISDLRDLSRSLNTDYIADMGLQKALEYELGLINKSTLIKTELKTEGQAFRMDKQKELILFRIVQEALNNTIKHAYAKNINAAINYNNDKLELSIIDDGKGFAITEQTTENGAGLGLRNMQNRAKLIAAEFSISSSPENGTTIKIVMPVNPAGQKENQ
jgi:signal transduction histidine kinase